MARLFRGGGVESGVRSTHPRCSTHLRLSLDSLETMSGEPFDFTVDTAPTGRNSKAQGETLGLVRPDLTSPERAVLEQQTKLRNVTEFRVSLSRPFRACIENHPHAPGFHPGLSYLALSGLGSRSFGSGIVIASDGIVTHRVWRIDHFVASSFPRAPRTRPVIREPVRYLCRRTSRLPHG